MQFQGVLNALSLVGHSKPGSKLNQKAGSSAQPGSPAIIEPSAREEVTRDQLELSREYCETAVAQLQLANTKPESEKKVLTLDMRNPSVSGDS